MQDKVSEQAQGYKYSEGKQETPGTNERADLEAGRAENREAGPGRRHGTKQQKHMVQENKRHMATTLGKKQTHSGTRRKS